MDIVVIWIKSNEEVIAYLWSVPQLFCKVQGWQQLDSQDSWEHQWAHQRRARSPRHQTGPWPPSYLAAAPLLSQVQEVPGSPPLSPLCLKQFNLENIVRIHGSLSPFCLQTNKIMWLPQSLEASQYDNVNVNYCYQCHYNYGNAINYCKNGSPDFEWKWLYNGNWDDNNHVTMAAMSRWPAPSLQWPLSGQHNNLLRQAAASRPSPGLVCTLT